MDAGTAQLSRKLTSLAFQAQASILITQALRAGVFEALAEPCTYNCLSERLGLEPENLLYLMRILLVGGVCEVAGPDSVQLSTAARSLLTQEGEDYIGDFLLLMDEQTRTLVSGDPLKDGKPGIFFDGEGRVPGFRIRRMTHAMSQKSGVQRIETILDILERFESFRNGSRILDLGGGAGYYAMSMIRRQPTREVEILDRPEVIEEARSILNGKPGVERIHFRTDDFVTASLGVESWDAVFASHSLICETAHLESIFRRIYKGLRSGGILAIVFFPEERALEFSLPTLVGDLVNYVCFGYGQVVSREMFKSLIRQAGFTSIEVIPFEDSDILVATRALEFEEEGSR